MKGFFNTLLADRIVKRSARASLILLFITLVYIAILYRNLPPFIPVFNQLPWGTERLGERITVFLPILMSTVIIIGNLLFSRLLYERMPLVVRMICITTFFISFITFIFVIRTTLLIL